MVRSLTSQMQTVSEAEVVNLFYLIDFEFDSGTVRLWTGLGDLVWNSETYTGAGNILSIGDLRESSEVEATGAQFVLSGVSPTLISLAQNEDYQGRTVTMRVGAFDGSGNIIADPFVIFSGFMDTMRMEDQGETATIALTAENKLISFERASVWRYTDQDQKIDYPDDKGFEYVTAIAEAEIPWGRADAGPPQPAPQPFGLTR